MERLSRQQRQRQTREQLLAAAARLFAERGLGASLDDIAASVGMTKGAVYSNFANKEALVLALIERRKEYQHRDVNDVSPSLEDSTTPVSQRIADLGSSYQQSIETPETRDFALLLMDFWVAAMRNARMRDAYVQVLHQFRDHLVQAITRMADEAELPANPADLASILIAVDMGIAIQHLIEPSEDTGRRYALAFGLIAGKALRDSGPCVGTGDDPNDKNR